MNGRAGQVIFTITLAACSAKQPTKTATCVQVADHVRALLDLGSGPGKPARPNDDHARDIRDAFAKRCEQDHWSGDVRACVLGTKSLKDPHHCKDKLEPMQRSALESNLEAADDKQRARLPTECVVYEQLAGKLATCDKLPQTTRDAMKQAFETSKATWPGNTNKVALGAICQAAAASLKQAAAAACGW